MKAIIKKQVACLSFVTVLMSVFLFRIQNDSAVAKKREITNLTETQFLLDEVTCDFNYIKEEKGDYLEIIVRNNGICNIYEWCITFEADYFIEKCEGAEIISNNNVKQLKYLKENAVIHPNDNIIISLKIKCNQNYNGENKIRKYGKYDIYELYRKSIDLNSLRENVDVICYNSETKETSLMTFDGHFNNNETEKKSQEYIVPQSSKQEENGSLPKVIIGDENMYKVTNVTSNPYCRIAHLYTDEPAASGNDHSRCTGFMVSNKMMLTSAHVVYTYIEGVCNEAVDGVTAYFEANDTSYSMKKTAKSWYWSAAYPNTLDIDDDWGAIEFNDNIGSSTGWFSIGYATNTTLNSRNFRICGYPIPKMENCYSSPIHQNRVYMYRSDSGLCGILTYQLRYTADTLNGQSGSPVWATVNNTVYGIHHGGKESWGYNVARRITKSLFDMMEDYGWIS